jgi:hypothetical protein
MVVDVCLVEPDSLVGEIFAEGLVGGGWVLAVTGCKAQAGREFIVDGRADAKACAKAIAIVSRLIWRRCEFRLA